MSTRHIQGLTLLEMLVVLIIAGMAIAIGFQSLEQWRRADTAIASFTQQSRQDVLVQMWTQASIRALYPVEERVFAGDSESWSGVTLQPVFASQGGAMDVAWRINRPDADLVLEIEEAGKMVQVPLQGAVSAEFEYMDRDGRGYAQWPPALGLHDHLPSSVILRLENASGTQRLWGAGIAGIRNPVQVVYEADTE